MLWELIIIPKLNGQQPILTDDDDNNNNNNDAADNKNKSKWTFKSTLAFCFYKK